MKKVNLRGTKLKVPKLCVGTFQVSDQWSKKFEKKKFFKILSICKKNKFQFIDTADSYQKGLIEKNIGKFIKINQREKWTIATKFGQLNGYGFDKIEFNLESSLRRLNTEYIDLYYFHSGTKKQFLNLKLWDYLNKQVIKGKIKYLGYSLSFDELKKFKNSDFKYLKEFNIKVVQLVYNPIFTIGQKILLKNSKKNNIGIVTRGTLAKGILTKKKLDFSQSNKKTLTFKKIDINENDYNLKTKYMQLSNLHPIHSTFKEILKKKSINSIICGVSEPKQLIKNIKYINDIK
tara:strand:+ start:116 stop:985 length:870 start_codon:yes stop_codon:yes gene_type:complete